MPSFRPPTRWLLFAALIASAACRSNPSSPNPGPTPTPGYPSTRPNSTILENIPLIRSLEQRMRQDTVLLWLGGAATQEGVVDPGSRWRYQFGQINPTRLYQWSVLPSGQVEYDGEQPYLPSQPPLDFNEVGSLITIDSPEMARLGRAYGGQPFVDRFPNSYVGISYRLIAREPVGVIGFNASGVLCSEGPIYIHARSGDLMARELGCLNLLSAPGNRGGRR